MKIASCLVVLLGISPAVASAQLASKIAPTGVVNELRAGAEVVLSDLALSVEKPEWSGRMVDQRDVAPKSVHARRDGPNTFLAMPMEGDEFKGRLIQRVTRIDDGLSLDYEIFPDDDIEIEAVVLQGRLPAGKLSYSADGEAPKTIADEPADDPLIWSGEPKSLELTIGGRTLRLSTRDAELQLIDDRKAEPPGFLIRAAAGGGEHLARKPIHLGLTIRAGDQ